MNPTEAWRQTSRSAGEEGRPGGPPPRDDPREDDPRLVQALREYQAALDAGQRPSKREFLSRYPGVAAELSECLAGLDLMRCAATRMQAPEPPPDAVGSSEGRLGDFQLLREIGRGGMGVVYEAVQLSLGRRVALKVLPMAATLDGRQMQRFENEARAAAHLHHAGIVPVFAVGSERGVPYYAMQLIDGRSLAAVIADLRRHPAPVAPAADTVAEADSLTQQSAGSKGFYRAVARAGVQAAEALEYAHQMGVLHRDVKPANLLLDARGKVWVTDFGLARFQECPGLTSPGDVVGTLRYMSPEQAAGRPVVDPRSDVYALGATLYELLAQRPAFPAHDRRECLRQILDEEPVTLRRLSKAVPVELETIVHKAMARSAEDRYGTAQELADDLRRYLDDQPIRARPPGLRERLARWSRRHRSIVTAAAVVLLIAAVGLAVTAWRVARAEARAQAAYRELKGEQERTQAAYGELKTEQGRTQAALKEEAAQRSRAEENYRKARAVLDYLNRLGVEEMAGKPELQALRRRLLARLLDYYQAFIDQQGSATPAADELAEAQLQVSELLVEVGRKADALAAFEKAMRDRGGPSPQPAGPPRGIARLFLLGQPAVQGDLKLSAEQVERVKGLLDFGDRPPSNEEATAAEQGLNRVLRPDQAGRLEQLIRQIRGPQELLDAETAGTLRLSERQKEQIQGLLDTVRPGRCAPAGRRDWGRLVAERKQAEERALRVLSAEQRARWRTLLGKPFRGDIRVGPRRERPKARGAMTWACYEGTWDRLPDFDKLVPAARGIGPALDLGQARRRENYAMRFEGFFRLEREADCTFFLTSDDGSRLIIDGTPVVDNDGPHPMRTRQGRVRLARGTHRVVVTYFQTWGEADLAVEVHAPGLGRHNLGDRVAATEADAPR